MEHILSMDLFSNEFNITNVCYLTARLVDKLWQGQLSRDPHEVNIHSVLYLNDRINFHSKYFPGVRLCCQINNSN